MSFASKRIAKLRMIATDVATRSYANR